MNYYYMYIWIYLVFTPKMCYRMNDGQIYSREEDQSKWSNHLRDDQSVLTSNPSCNCLSYVTETTQNNTGSSSVYFFCFQGRQLWPISRDLWSHMQRETHSPHALVFNFLSDINIRLQKNTHVHTHKNAGGSVQIIFVVNTQKRGEKAGFISADEMILRQCRPS